MFSRQQFLKALATFTDQAILNADARWGRQMASVYEANAALLRRTFPTLPSRPVPELKENLDAQASALYVRFPEEFEVVARLIRWGQHSSLERIMGALPDEMGKQEVSIMRRWCLANDPKAGQHGRGESLDISDLALPSL